MTTYQNKNHIIDNYHSIDNIQILENFRTNKTQALENLRLIGNFPTEKTQDISWLLELLGQADEEILRHLLVSLIQVGIPAESKMILLDILKKPSQKSKTLAALALTYLNNFTEEEKKFLLDIAKQNVGQDFTIYSQLVYLLGNLRYKKAFAELHIMYENEIYQRTPALLALDKIGIPDVSSWIAALESPDDNICRYAIWVMVQQYPDDIPVHVLEKISKDIHSDARRYAIWALGKIGKGNPECLIPACCDDDLEIRQLAVYALGKIGQKREGMISAILYYDPHKMMKDCLIWAIEQLKVETNEEYIALLTCSISKLRRYALIELGRRGCQEAIPYILAGLKKYPEKTEVYYAIWALGKIVFTSTSTPFDWRWMENHPTILLSFIEYARESCDPELRNFGLSLLYYTIPQMWYPELIQVFMESAPEKLSQADKLWRNATIWLLEKLATKNSEAIGHIIQACSSEYKDTRSYALSVLSKIRLSFKSCIDCLQDHDSRTNFLLQQLAFWEMAQQTERQYFTLDHPFIQALQKGDKKTRLYGIWALGKIGIWRHGMEKILCDAAGDDEELQEYAIWAFGQLSSDCSEEMVNYLCDKAYSGNERVQEAAVWALAKMGCYNEKAFLVMLHISKNPKSLMQEEICIKFLSHMPYHEAMWELEPRLRSIVEEKRSTRKFAIKILRTLALGNRKEENKGSELKQATHRMRRILLQEIEKGTLKESDRDVLEVMQKNSKTIWENFKIPAAIPKMGVVKIGKSLVSIPFLKDLPRPQIEEVSFQPYFESKDYLEKIKNYLREQISAELSPPPIVLTHNFQEDMVTPKKPQLLSLPDPPEPTFLQENKNLLDGSSVVLLEVRGAIYGRYIAQLEEKLLEGRESASIVILSLSVEYIENAGVAMLAQIAKTFYQANKQLLLSGISPNIEPLIFAFRYIMDAFLPVYKTIEEALFDLEGNWKGDDLQYHPQEQKLPDGTNALVLRLKGVLIEKTIQEFEHLMNLYLQQGYQNIILEFSRISKITSPGLSSLIKLTDKFQQINGDVFLASVPEKFSPVFDMLGMGFACKIYSSVDEAGASIARLHSLFRNKTTKEIAYENTGKSYGSVPFPVNKTPSKLYAVRSETPMIKPDPKNASGSKSGQGIRGNKKQGPIEDKKERDKKVPGPMRPAPAFERFLTDKAGNPGIFERLFSRSALLMKAAQTTFGLKFIAIANTVDVVIDSIVGYFQGIFQAWKTYRILQWKIQQNDPDFHIQEISKDLNIARMQLAHFLGFCGFYPENIHILPQTDIKEEQVYSMAQENTFALKLALETRGHLDQMKRDLAALVSQETTNPVPKPKKSFWMSLIPNSGEWFLSIRNILILAFIMRYSRQEIQQMYLDMVTSYWKLIAAVKKQPDGNDFSAKMAQYEHIIFQKLGGIPYLPDSNASLETHVGQVRHKLQRLIQMLTNPSRFVYPQKWSRYDVLREYKAMESTGCWHPHYALELERWLTRKMTRLVKGSISTEEKNLRYQEACDFQRRYKLGKWLRDRMI